MLPRTAFKAARTSQVHRSVARLAHTNRPSLNVHSTMADNCVVTPAWVKERLGQPGLKVLDASWYMPQQGRNGLAEFKQERIPGARFFDVDRISDPNTDLPHMLPSNAAFSAAMDCLGIQASDTVVVYDGMGLFSAPRAWWTFKVFGHEKVYVMEGGLPGWKAVEGPLDTSGVSEDDIMAPANAAREAMLSGRTDLGDYPAKLDNSKVRSIQQMLQNINAADGAREQVMDARSLGRFVGTEPEPRKGLKGGHIPGARNIPFPAVLEQGGRLKTAEQLQPVFQQAQVDVNKPLVGSCGSGLTACILALAAYRLSGGKLVSIYDGSWSEWGAKEDVPISTEAP